MENKNFFCKNCNKQLLAENTDKGAKSSIVIKNQKLIFLNGDGQVLAKCKKCSCVNALPISFNISPK